MVSYFAVNIPRGEELKPQRISNLINQCYIMSQDDKGNCASPGGGSLSAKPEGVGSLPEVVILSEDAFFERCNNLIKKHVRFQAELIRMKESTGFNS